MWSRKMPFVVAKFDKRRANKTTHKKVLCAGVAGDTQSANALINQLQYTKINKMRYHDSALNGD